MIPADLHSFVLFLDWCSKL